jgi:hypothetical protein
MQESVAPAFSCLSCEGQRFVDSVTAPSASP